MDRSRIPLVLALITFVLALLSGFHAYHRLIRTVPVLVAVRDLSPGGALIPEAVRVDQVPAGALPPQSLSDTGQIAGMYPRVPVFAGQILTARQISKRPPEQDPLASIGPDERAVSIPVRMEAVLGGALRPGDIVEVVAVWPGEDGKAGTFEIIASGVRVLDLRNVSGRPTQATGKAAGDGSDGESEPDARVPASVTLRVTVEQGKALVSAVESKAALYLWLMEREQP